MGSPERLAPYSAGVIANGVPCVSGTLAFTEDGIAVGVGDVVARTCHVSSSLKNVSETANGGLEDVVFRHFSPKHLADLATMKGTCEERFPVDPAAAYRIRADLVKPEFLVEISTVARVED